MGDNSRIKTNGRFSIVDPNNFDYQYTGDMFGDTNYNMSVPPEELCIVVELVTTSKGRSVLINSTQNGTITTTKSTEGGDFVSFITGKNDATTGYGNFLTTSYTDLGTENIIEEALGITNVKIDFNSSMAPMVNIDFIDVRGGAIFQSGAKSIYNVLFRLPYPLFELKVKGFYGKSVVYCLHMVKCNTRFNSQTGNFEISASFVGYTYAMLADMIVGYVRAAARMPDGIDLLASKNTISINEFMTKMNNIDALIKTQLEDSSNQNRNNYALANQLETDLIVIEDLINGFILNIKDSSVANTTAGEVPEPYTNSIVFVADPAPNSSSTDFSDTKTFKFCADFVAEYNKKIADFNTKVGDLTTVKIAETTTVVPRVITKVNDLIGPNGGPTNKTLISRVQNAYGGIIDATSNENITETIKKLQAAAPKTLSANDAYVKTYDVTDIRNFVRLSKDELAEQKKELTVLLAEDLAKTIKNELEFQPNIRNVFRMFTAHIEVFLELVFNVSSQYLNEDRINELKKFRSKDKTNQRLDIKKSEDAVIYPWPEYIENDQERYLGAAGVLTNPLKVPEVKFVEDLYAQMIKNIEEDKQVQANGNGTPSWQAFSPIDSNLSIDILPYNRLADSATHNDIARLIVLRATGLLGYENNYIDDTEIESFAKAEAQSIIEKYKTNKIIIPALAQNYDTVDKYSQVKGTVNSKEVNVLQSNNNTWEYKYIETSFPKFNRYELPVDKGFNNVTSPYYGNYSTLKLSNRTSGLAYTPDAEKGDSAKYIDFIESNKYETGKDVTSPLTSGPSVFKYGGLSKDLTAPKDFLETGFFLSNGKYGVQDFTLIDYSSKSEYGTSGNLSFFSLFYDNPLINNEYETNLPGLSTPRIKKVGDLTVDMAYSGGNFGAYTFIDDTNYFGSPTDLTNWFFQKLNAPNNNHESVGKNITLFNNETTQDQVAFPFLNFGIYSDITYDIPTFGSRFYNAQDTYSAKTFLFLHSLPWRGLMGQSAFETGIGSMTNYVGILKQKELINTFSGRTGYIQVPKLWPAFIGGLLWRYESGKSGTDPIKFIGTSSTDNLIPTINSDYPKYNQFLKVIPTGKRIAAAAVEKPITQGILGYWLSSPASLVQSNYPMCFSDKTLTTEYPQIDDELIALPPPAKKMFINEFVKFVQEFESDISNTLELKPKDTSKGSNDANWKSAWLSINNSTIIDTSNATLVKHELNNIGTYVALNKPANINAHLTNGANPDKLEEDYAILTYNYYNFKEKTVNGVTIPVTNNINNYNFFIEYKQNGKVETKLKELFFSKTYIENDSTYMWSNGINNTNPIVYFSKSRFSKYIDTINQELKTKVAEDQKTIVNTTENEQIKLEIYRTIKKIYDKWIAGVAGGPRSFSNILFQCCERGTNIPNRLTGDTEINKILGGTGKEDSLNLIDSFRFVTRSFEDIGTKFQINPVTVTHELYQSSDTSIYDLFGRILTENNFEFIALPNFINYNDPKELGSVFEPYPYYMADKQTATGPSFVCVYVGQTSTKLDFGENSDYPNDGFDITNDKTWPKDFSDEKASWEDFASAFVVRYGQQNQNIFKDIRLDQSEFNETAESLAITDAISNSLSKTNQSYVGQNLYNVYSVRSYKAEVEMMGNAMIQPMMYFQLDSIPMFHGAYLITKVSHTIVPNNMITTFTGTRIRIAKTPIIDIATLYSALLAGNEIGPASAGNAISTNNTAPNPPIIKTIRDNGAENAHLTQTFGSIKLSPVNAPDGVQNNCKNRTETDANSIDQFGNSLIEEASRALEKMLTDFVAYAKTNNLPKNGNNYISINSLYRNYKKQQSLAGPGAAGAGSSNHGWGIAVDFQFIDKDGNMLRNQSQNPDAIKKGFDQKINTSLPWFLENSYKYGFWMPIGLRNGAGLEEFWHFEYHAKTAICLWQNYPTVNNSNNVVKIPDNATYDASVANPKNPDGTVAVYNGCGFVKANDNTGDGTSGDNNSALLWMYLSWQQGSGGASQHYKVANGTMAKYQISAENISKNWPSGSISDDNVKSSDIQTLYNSNPKKLANAFINVWGKFVVQKSEEAIKKIESSAKNRINTPYLSFKDVFKKYEKPSVSWKDIATIGNIENGLNTDTNPDGTFQTMFQMNKTYPEFSTLINSAKKGSSGYKSFVNYDIDKITEGFVPLLISNFDDFKRRSGFNPSAPSSIGASPGSVNSTVGTPTTLDTIIIGDSLSPCIESQVIKKNGKARRISPNSGEASLWKGGEGVSWLIKSLNKYPVSTAVKNVVISIGTNGGFNTRSDNQSGLMSELRRVFPNAKYIFVTGSYGWGGNVNITQANVTTYYNVYKNAGATIINGFGYVGSDADAHSCSVSKIPTLPTMISDIIRVVGG